MFPTSQTNRDSVESEHQTPCPLVAWAERSKPKSVGKSRRILLHSREDTTAALVGLGTRRPEQLCRPVEDAMQGAVVLVVFGSVLLERNVPVAVRPKCVREVLHIEQREREPRSPRRIG